MSTQVLTTETPIVLPHGWKKEVAETLGIHPNTVKTALKRGINDPTYKHIMKCAKEKYGQKR
ncbi:hypothetical protein SDC9_169675 [bioreactor metagenome]|uniref:Uncharacterized protein n=1 Tax=bioreactor metagenome TaxID=1076179 RepID=A0A645G8J5_9ZZZZ|nr:hypothetical protein [Paludibacter sp.]